ncbi:MULTISPECIES: hypothetical protein [unclassified Clostridium]|uniref:phage neck terminator protein n=1 Tax=unclassified Clostridium TaxID=2614128 RepID=UPI0002978212|nr:MULTISPECIES: hypothetical protein [unclassified Clostridium]EKQ56270.1 MAG: hypothetical protein A370_02026 [Clostridium sp. Maddingley MBC34-26]
MSDQILILKELEDFFASITYMILGLDPTLKENKGKVRLAWPKDGAPSWKIDDDICFLRITPIDDRQARQLNIIYSPDEEDKDYLKKKTGYTRVHKIDWTFYGPNSYDNADLIRYSILEPHLYKETFKEKNLFIITDVPMPTRLPELYNGQWWERTDFSATFNEAVIRETKIPYIKSASFELIKDK